MHRVVKFFNKKTLIFLAVLAVVVFIILARPKTDPDNLAGNIFGNSTAEKTGVNQDVPMADNGEPIQIAYTDDNGGENLIIATDKQIYNGFSGSEVHISLTNKDGIDHNGQLLFYFPAKDDTKIKLPATVKKMQVYQAGKWQPVGISTAAISTNDPILKDALAKQKGIPENMSFKGTVNFSAKSGETIYFKAEINYPPGGIGEFFIEGIADHGGYGLLDPYYSSSYLYRRPLIINHNKVSTVSKTTLSNFPVLVSVTNTDLKASTSGGYVQRVTGNDILFTDSTGSTKLSYELESYNGTTGNVVAWVKIASLTPAADTTIYMYYDNATATDQSDAASVWDTSYKSVIHFKETSGTLSDSSGNNNTAAPLNGASSTGSGLIGNAYSFDGTNDMASISNNASWAANTTKFSVEFWIKIVTPETYSGAIVAGDWIGNTFSINNSSPTQYWGASITQTGPTWTTAYVQSSTLGYLSTADNTFHHIGYTFNSDTGYAYLYSDGVQVGYTQYTQGTTNLGANDLCIGGFCNGQYLTSVIDEVRISNGAVRSADWIKTEYNNQSSPNTFIGMNAPQTPTRTAPSVAIVNQGAATVGYYSSSYLYRRPLIINHNKVSTVSKTTLSNFPVLVSVTNTDLKASTSGGYVQRVTGNDILFTDSTGSTKLSYELESYNGTTGNVVAWVKIASLTPAADTTIYMYYDNATATDQSNATGVWDDGGSNYYKGVWHLPNGTTLSVSDSTTTNTTSNNNTTATTGQIDGGDALSGSSQYINIGNNAALQITGDMTIEAWIKPTDYANYNGIVGKTSSNMPAPYDFYLAQTSGIPRFYRGNGSAFGEMNGTAAPSTGVWSHIAVTMAGTAVTHYLNGATNGNGALSTTIGDGGTSALIGSRNDLATMFKGSMDEVRISNSARSADWVKTEYNNQNNPGSFVGLGAAQSSARTAPFIKIRGGVQFR